MRSKLGKVNISWGIVALVLKHHVVIMQTCSVLHCKIRHKPLNKRGDTKTWAPLCYHCGNILLLLNCSCGSKNLGKYDCAVGTRVAEVAQSASTQNFGLKRKIKALTYAILLQY